MAKTYPKILREESISLDTTGVELPKELSAPKVTIKLEETLENLYTVSVEGPPIKPQRLSSEGPREISEELYDKFLQGLKKGKYNILFEQPFHLSPSLREYSSRK